MMPISAHNLRYVLHDGKTERPLLYIPELEITAGSSLAITGPSGSGKTTLLHILSGLLKPSDGEVFWGTTAIYSLGPGKRDALRASCSSMIFQDFQLLSGLSALDNVLLPLTFRQWTVRPQSVEAARNLLQSLGILHPYTRAERLSRGEMQRVALARAFSGSCEILFADEPTASLDADNAARVIDSLDDLCRSRVATLVCVTHDTRLMHRMEHCIHLDRSLCIETVC